MAVKPPPWISKSQTSQVGPTPKGGGLGKPDATLRREGGMTGPGSMQQMHDAFLGAEKNVRLTKEGNGGYDLHHSSLKPMRSLGQESSVKKAAAASGIKRSLNKGMPRL